MFLQEHLARRAWLGGSHAGATKIERAKRDGAHTEGGFVTSSLNLT